MPQFLITSPTGVTILPLLSQVEPSCEFGEEERAALTTRIQNAGTEVVEAKAGGENIRFLTYLNFCQVQCVSCFDTIV